jgi:hypothetical protein
MGKRHAETFRAMICVDLNVILLRMQSVCKRARQTATAHAVFHGETDRTSIVSARINRNALRKTSQPLTVSEPLNANPASALSRGRERAIKPLISLQIRTEDSPLESL